MGFFGENASKCSKCNAPIGLNNGASFSSDGKGGYMCSKHLTDGIEIVKTLSDYKTELESEIFKLINAFENKHRVTVKRVVRVGDNDGTEKIQIIAEI